MSLKKSKEKGKRKEQNANKGMIFLKKESEMSPGIFMRSIFIELSLKQNRQTIVILQFPSFQNIKTTK